MENNKTPSIRFKGFTDPWEQRKLNELVIIERGGSPRPIDKFITNDANGLNWVKIGDAPQQGNYITKTAEKIIPEGLSKTREVHPGDLILSNSMSFGKPYIMAINGCIHDGWLLIRDTNKVFDLKFLCQMLGIEQMLSQYKALAAGSTVNNLNKELVGNTNVKIPNIKEQQQIGDYFANLDNLITLHQRKYNKLLNVKKSMLEKMFPKNGSNIPEIRFKGFTDPWEQRKLGELCNITTGKLDANAMVSDGQYDFYTSGIDVFKIDVAAFEGPAITIAGNGASVGYMHLADGKFNAYQRTYVLTDFLADRQFLNVAIGNELPDKIQEEVRGSGIPYIVLNMLTDLAIPFPSHEEQYAIGVYFQQLDNLITLHQRELEKLQNIKKSMLEKMFV